MKKFRDSRGFTLTELLCAVLIVLLISALLVVGIRFAGNTYNNSMKLSEAQELCSTLTNAINDKLRFCGTVTQDEDGSVTQIFILNMGSVEGEGEAFRIDENGQILLGEKKLLSAAAYPRGLRVEGFSLRFDAETNIFTVSLSIGDGSGGILAQTDFEVKRLNRR